MRKLQVEWKDRDSNQIMGKKMLVIIELFVMCNIYIILIITPKKKFDRIHSQRVQKYIYMYLFFENIKKYFMKYKK